MSDGGAYCFLEKIEIRQVLLYSNSGEMSKNLNTTSKYIVVF
jgi:hypothetical protein